MNDWEKEMRDKSKKGNLTLEDMKEIVNHFSKGRDYAMFSSKKSKSVKKKKENEMFVNDDNNDPFEGL